MIACGNGQECRREFPLEELLGDPIALLLMQRDRVDPAEVRELVRRGARTLRRREAEVRREVCAGA